MYAVTEPRTAEDAIKALIPPDADYSIHRLLDAMLALPQFGHPNMPGFTGDDPQRAVFGNRATWTYEKARAVIDHAFGPDGHIRLLDCVARYRNDPVTAFGEGFLLQVGILLRGGWTERTGWEWFAALGHKEMPIQLATAWVGMWSLDVFNACLRAGLDVYALNAISDSGVLPLPETVAMLGGLRRDPIAAQG